MTTLTLSSSFNFASDQDWGWVVFSATASSGTLGNATNYFITFAPGTIKDLAGNA